MNSTAVIISTAIALPVAALLAWMWITVAQIDRELRAGFEGMHFDI